MKKNDISKVEESNSRKRFQKNGRRRVKGTRWLGPRKEREKKKKKERGKKAGKNATQRRPQKQTKMDERKTQRESVCVCVFSKNREKKNGK